MFHPIRGRPTKKLVKGRQHIERFVAILQEAKKIVKAMLTLSLSAMIDVASFSSHECQNTSRKLSIDQRQKTAILHRCSEMNASQKEMLTCLVRPLEQSFQHNAHVCGNSGSKRHAHAVLVQVSEQLIHQEQECSSSLYYSSCELVSF